MKVVPREISVGDEIFIEGMVWNDSDIVIWEPVVIQMAVDDMPAGEPIVLPGLFPREARRVAVTIRAPEVGEHMALMFVDPEDLIRERREENNHKAVPFEVLPHPGESMMQ